MQNLKDMKDISNLDDIKVFVNGFYQEVRNDETLAPIFNSRIAPDQWDKHLQRMYDFWNSILFFQKGYKGNPFSKHAQLPIDAYHFDRWTSLFKKIIDDNFQGPVAEETKVRAKRIAMVFLSKLNHQRNIPSFQPVM